MKVHLLKETGLENILKTADRDQLAQLIRVLVSLMEHKVTKEEAQPKLNSIQDIETMIYEAMEVMDSINDEESN